MDLLFNAADFGMEFEIHKDINDDGNDGEDKRLAVARLSEKRPAKWQGQERQG